MPIMPIPGAPKPIQPVIPKAVSNPEKSILVDTRFEPKTDLLQYIEGKPWTVDYFQAVVAEDDEVSYQQTGVGAPFQQYRCIHQYRLMVTAALNSSVSQSEQAKSMTIEGSANLFPGLIPNVGDSFIGDIGDGRLGLFRVTASTRKMYLRESCYEISYVLVGFADKEDRFIEDLKAKVIQDFWWHQSYMHFGSDPKLTNTQYKNVVDIDRLYYELLNQYLVEFFSNERQTFLVPGQDKETYDPFMTKFFLKLASSETHPYIGRIKTPTVDQHLVTRYPTVLDALLDRSLHSFKYNIHKARLVPTKYFRHEPLLSGVYYSGVEDLVFPFQMDHVTNNLHAGKHDFMDKVLIKEAAMDIKDLDRLLGQMNLDGLYWKHVQEHLAALGLDKLKDIVPVTIDDYYIFSAPMYLQQLPTSKLEALTLSLLKKDHIETDVLHYLMQVAQGWFPLERYYYTPVLLILARSVLRGQYGQ